MLCNFAHAFPSKLAQLLGQRPQHADASASATALDLLLIGLASLQGYGVRVGFGAPPEAAMDWIFAAPNDVGGGSYLRLRIQAKLANRDGADAWTYGALGDPQQTNSLGVAGAPSDAGDGALGLYMLFHPAPALAPALDALPPIEGINLLFADDVRRAGAAPSDAAMATWRPQFLTLADLLCWPMLSKAPPPNDAGLFDYLFQGQVESAALLSVAWHPELVAYRLNDLRARRSHDGQTRPPRPPIAPARPIPPSLLQALAATEAAADPPAAPGRRVLFTTPMRSGDVDMLAWRRRMAAPGEQTSALVS